MSARALLDGSDAVGLRRRLSSREISCADVARDLLDAIGEDALHAWAAIDPSGLAGRAAALDRLGPAEREALPLFGVPVAIKDNFDTAELPTEYGSPIYAGARPDTDAGVVAALRGAGALIAGKLKCAEFAWMTPPDTLNPLDLARTPGGSSSGSAAAVAAGTIPLATGTQTAGSINRPASYCGVLGFKPTFGRYSRAGVKQLAGSLDTVGMFARSVPDLALADAVLGGRGRVSESAPAADPPRIGFARTALWSQHVSVEAQDACEAAVVAARAAGVEIEDVILPEGFAAMAEAQTTIQMYESAASLAPELRASPELLSDDLRVALEAGAAIQATSYEAALGVRAEFGPALVGGLRAFAGVLTPSADGVPPLGLGFTGDPLFCRVWTLIGAPSLSLPLAWTPDGLPAGLQLVGAPGADSSLLAAAAWLMERLVRP